MARGGRCIKGVLNEKIREHWAGKTQVCQRICQHNKCQKNTTVTVDMYTTKPQQKKEQLFRRTREARRGNEKKGFGK